jgi:hypothetical protein
MSQFDEEGNGPSSENGPNGDKKDKVEKKKRKGKVEGNIGNCESVWG